MPSAITATFTRAWKACRITITTITSTESGFTTLRRGARIAPRVLAPGRITLLRSQAGPLAGDHDRVEIVVESGVLTVEPIAATLALPGLARTVLELDVTVGDGARLVLEDAPLIVAEGADVLRTTTIRLGVGASAIVRDLVVLGRAGEGPGRLESVLRVEGPDGVILHDALRIDPGEDDAYVALAPGHRAIGMVATFGERRVSRVERENVDGRGAETRGGELADGAGHLWRASGASAADVVAQLARVR
ncbi:urease accessory protein UreD [Solirubrobacter ginsenosidimutans]|uniref:Urease accessory protein UreD n=1 Tax=Solirubrobacter ginsenosidimutans TaxID=490573 RepID=A0A9X3S3L1_9ACTN|nr:urease accessory protein UreD [Solirubrobacter ginsenosidimutans]MDA0165855.1 urease accessory protein UreD [Solirubrobacter ginsenosidimutans]